MDNETISAFDLLSEIQTVLVVGDNYADAWSQLQTAFRDRLVGEFLGEDSINLKIRNDDGKLFGVYQNGNGNICAIDHEAIIDWEADSGLTFWDELLK